MSVTIMSRKKYDEVAEEGTQICIMCGQWNSKKERGCWYCGSSHIVPMVDTGCIRASDNLPVSRDDGSYTVDTMILSDYSEEPKRIASFKATKAYKPEGD